ncbi:hypothetical protein AMELA_G00097550 [Ameiurus melas]|uniref:Uncharacterized protein n=1 Tax=Ameiurus melas TaxID=219545 RepID=A0A7J6AU44_AMEME|nr:hypothetical protein AMELA_G00097550 [Ameiurus melas]
MRSHIIMEMLIGLGRINFHIGPGPPIGLSINIEPELKPSTEQAQETSSEQATEPNSTTSIPKGVKVVKKRNGRPVK